MTGRGYALPRLERQTSRVVVVDLCITEIMNEFLFVYVIL